MITRARAAIGALLAAAIVASVAAPAVAAPARAIDCATAPSDSPAADACRADHWTIRPRVAVSPRGIMRRHSLPSCTFEDGSGTRLPCSWNVRGTDGNGIGRAYYVTGSHRAPVFHYLAGVNVR